MSLPGRLGLAPVARTQPLICLRAGRHDLTPASLPAWQGAALMVPRHPGLRWRVLELKEL